MKYLLLVLLVINPLTDIDKIARVNKAKKQAEQHYLAGEYQEAHDKYKYLIDSLGVKNDKALLNLANAQYHLQDSINSLSNYKQLTSSTFQMAPHKIIQPLLGMLLKQEHRGSKGVRRITFSVAATTTPKMTQQREMKLKMKRNLLHPMLRHTQHH